MAVQINKTPKTPYVHLCSEKGVFILEGVILPEDSYEFFEPIMSYIKIYLNEPSADSTVILKLDYFNTSASRMLYNMLKSFDEMASQTSTVVEFYFEDDDEDLSEVCDEFSEMLTHLTFDKKPYKFDESPSFKELI